MGVDIQTYRSRVGSFCQGPGLDVVEFTVTCSFSKVLKQIGSVLFIEILLLLAGIEPNPGPFPEISHRMKNVLDQEDPKEEGSHDDSTDVNFAQAQAIPRLYESDNDISTEFSSRPTTQREFENKDKVTVKSDQTAHIPERGTDFENILCKFKLQDFYPEKICIMTVMAITEEKDPIYLEDVPWIILRKLIMLDFKARDDLLRELLKPFEDIGSVEQGISKRGRKKRTCMVNPLDFFLMLFCCCDITLKQMIYDRLNICRLGFPVLYSIDNRRLHLPLSCIRGLNLEWHNIGKNLEHFSLIDLKMKIVSFIRLGESGTSKSRFANSVLSDESHSVFFNRETSGGKTKRLLANGMIEVSWFLPSGKMQQVFSEPMLFCNLRGDANTYYQQLELLLETSSIILVFFQSKALSDQGRENLLRINNTAKVLVLNILIENNEDNGDDYEDEEEDDVENIIKSKNKDSEFVYAYTNDGVASDSINEIRGAITKFLEMSKDSSLSRFRDECKKFQVRCDEDEEICKNGKHLASKVISTLGKTSIHSLKDTHLTTQKIKWVEYTKLLKQKHQPRDSMNEESVILLQINNMLKLLAKECEKPTALMKAFMDVLLQYHEDSEIMRHFIYWVSLFLDEKCKIELPKLRQSYFSALYSTRQAEIEKDSVESERLQNEAVKVESLLLDSSFGFEHIVRELGHMFESIKLWPDNVGAETCDKIFKLPHIIAKLLVSGQCFELMDGDTGSVPIHWLKAVMNETINIIGDVNIVVLSVLGIQGSGKSTLLNAMFGLRYSVSAGRCTRGLYMQLVPVRHSNIEASYVLVIDTEGLRAPELADLKHRHDNELATFVIGLADITVVNIKGENTAEVVDILQIVVHAFLRLKAVTNTLKLNKSCIFIHQNVPSVNAEEKLRQGKQKLIQLLNSMTTEAAHQENIAEITDFKQVIQFDEVEHVWYFSDLWKGDPPMAPANTGYSDMVQDVKQTMFKTIVQSRKSFLVMSDWVTHVADLWNGILGENFVFEFRNSLEVKAFNTMEEQYIKLRWSLEEHVAIWIQTKSSKCKTIGDVLSLKEFIAHAHQSIEQMINDKKKEIKIQLETYFENDSLKEFSKQWKQSKLHNLDIKSEQLISTSKLEIMRLEEKRKADLTRKVKENKHRAEINAKAETLAYEFKGKMPSEDELTFSFDSMWNAWAKEIIQDEPAKILKTMEDDIVLVLEARLFSDHPILRKCMKSSPLSLPLNLEHLQGSFQTENIDDKFISMTNTISNKKRCKKLAVNFINEIFRKIDSFLTDLKSEDTEFQSVCINNILDIIIQGIGRHNATSKEYKLTPMCKIELVVHTFRHCLPIFKQLNDCYEDKHGVNAYLATYKEF